MGFMRSFVIVFPLFLATMQACSPFRGAHRYLFAHILVDRQATGRELKGAVRSCRVLQSQALRSGGNIRFRPYRLKRRITYDQSGLRTALHDYAESGVLRGRSSYRYDGRGRLVQWQRFRDNGLLWSRISYRYSPQGQLLEKQEWSKDRYRTMLRRECYRYNKQGLRLGKIILEGKDKPRWRIYYRYHGSDVTETALDEKGAVNYRIRYSCRGETLQAVSRKGDGGLLYKALFRFDRRGRIRRIDFRHAHQGIRTSQHYRYDGQGRLLGSKLVMGNGDTVEESGFRYGKDGRLLEEHHYKDGRYYKSDTRTRYKKFDHHGNWLEKTVSMRPGQGTAYQAVYRIRRKLTYF